MKTVNIQVRWAAAHPGQDRRLPGVVTHARPERAPARSWVGTTRRVAPGSLSSGPLGGRTLAMKGDGSVYSQAYVRARVLRPPGSSVAVRDRGHEKVSAGSGWAR